MSHLADSFHFNLHCSHVSDIRCVGIVVIMNWNFLQNQVSHSMKTTNLRAQGEKKKKKENKWINKPLLVAYRINDVQRLRKSLVSIPSRRISLSRDRNSVLRNSLFRPSSYAAFHLDNQSWTWMTNKKIPWFHFYGMCLGSRIKCFPSTPRRRNLKTQQSPVILDLCLRRTRSGGSHDYADAIVFKKLPFQNVFRKQENEKPAFSNSSGLKSVFKKLRFHDGLAQTVGLTAEIKLRFQISPA